MVRERFRTERRRGFEEGRAFGRDQANREHAKVRRGEGVLL